MRGSSISKKHIAIVDKDNKKYLMFDLEYFAFLNNYFSKLQKTNSSLPVKKENGQNVLIKVREVKYMYLKEDGYMKLFLTDINNINN